MLGRTILPILGVSLLEPSAELRGPFKEAILCVKGLIFFHLMVKYRSHTVRLGRLLRTLCGQYKILRGSSSRRELNLGLG